MSDFDLIDYQKLNFTISRLERAEKQSEKELSVAQRKKIINSAVKEYEEIKKLSVIIRKGGKR